VDDLERGDVVQGLGHLRDQLRGLAPRQSAHLVDQRRQGATVDHLHGQPMHASVEAAVMHADHVRMLDLGADLRFTLETRHQHGVGRCRFRQHLHRHAPLHRHLLGFVDHAHGSGAEASDEAAAADHLADQLVDLRCGRGPGHGH
jgi:hypothetical protein